MTNDYNSIKDNIRIGIDIGGTSVKIGLVSGLNRIIDKSILPINKNHSYDEFLSQIIQIINTLISKNDIKNIRGIGIGAPNGDYINGTIHYAPNLPWKKILPIAKDIEEALTIPTKLTNDANAAALGEWKHGKGRGMTNFVMITLGTGLGCGIVSENEIIHGNLGFAGELGHITAIPEGRMCNCGRKGCLESYVSATGIVKTAYDFIDNKTTKSSLREIKNISSKNIDEEARKGDKLAIEIFDYTANILGLHLANTAAILNPEAIILSGGLSLAGNAFSVPVHKYFDFHLMEQLKEKTELIFSSINNDGAIIGAAGLV